MQFASNQNSSSNSDIKGKIKNNDIHKQERINLCVTDVTVELAISLNMAPSASFQLLAMRFVQIGTVLELHYSRKKLIFWYNYGCGVTS